MSPEAGASARSAHERTSRECQRSNRHIEVCVWLVQCLDRKCHSLKRGSVACPQFLTKPENSRKYFVQKSGTSAFNLRYSIKAQLREIIMINFTFGVPVKTRLPSRAWILAAIATLFSLASSLLYSHTPADNTLYAGMIWRLVWPS
jgi:hypothetical protein